MPHYTNYCVGSKKRLGNVTAETETVADEFRVEVRMVGFKPKSLRVKRVASEPKKVIVGLGKVSGNPKHDLSKKVARSNSLLS